MAIGDAKTNTFTEEGRILQVEYAIKNVSQAGTIVGLNCNDGVLLLGIKKGAVQSFKEKIYKLSEGIYCCVCGIFPDALQIVQYARVNAQNFLEEFGNSMPVSTLARKVGELKQGFTQSGGMRPFGVSFLYAGIKDNQYLLYSTDPSGTCNAWKGKAYGEFEDAINNGFKNDLSDDNKTFKEGLKSLIQIISKSRECNEESAPLFEVLHLSKDGCKFLTNEEIINVFKEIEKDEKMKNEKK
ncbi:subunit of proteasome [Hamiltosporidium magnivora]|uniref:Subunit of proteasome n=1 Tax=Hamiltosporidium magnivora TaxID=148818 RepID=A0A4Q9L719_9MICR|nr:subunit of proteasome [Hamiltosporidium magnivora]